MRILYVSQYFPPEMGAPAARVSEIARRWVERGHHVTVLTAFPNHPTGIIPPTYPQHVFLREWWGKVRVVRTYIYPTPNAGFLKRTLNYLSFMASSVLLGGPSTGAFDVVVATSPQLFVAAAGFALSRWKRAPYVLEIRDLWPQSIVVTVHGISGPLRNGAAAHCQAEAHLPPIRSGPRTQGTGAEGSERPRRTQKTGATPTE